MISNSFFGISYPKVTYNGNPLLLEHSVILNDRLIPDIIMQESIVNRHREWVVKGKHHLFEINFYLFKYGENKQDKYDEIKAMERNYVSQLFRRSDGVQIKDSSNADVQFLCDEVSEFYIKRYDYPDVLRIKFLSENYVDMTKSVIVPE